LQSVDNVEPQIMRSVSVLGAWISQAHDQKRRSVSQRLNLSVEACE
jgi:hypothetical protein